MVVLKTIKQIGVCNRLHNYIVYVIHYIVEADYIVTNASSISLSSYQEQAASRQPAIDLTNPFDYDKVKLMLDKTNASANSLKVEDVELTSAPIYPAWPPAELPQHECELPHVGLPHSTDHEMDDPLIKSVGLPI